jgi:TrpR family transcriptional regulator, trp operon repressor
MISSIIFPLLQIETSMNNNIIELSGLLAETSDFREIQEFLESILTPRELEDIASRWELVKRLDQGETQRQIAHDLHLSLCKITRGSRELKKRDAILKRFINRLNR